MSETPSPSKALAGLLSLLDLERIDDNLFRGRSINPGWQRVFGGQVLGQALMAAGRTVEAARSVHSLHGYFLIGGDPKHDIIYDVERVRDGGSFTTRRVKAIQHGRPIFVMSASFHVAEDGFEHQSAMPEVPPPESLPDTKAIADRLPSGIPEPVRAYLKRERPVELRPVALDRYLERREREPIQKIWLRASGTLPDDPLVHQSILAYASDFTLLDTALIAHGRLIFDADLQLASLDHALWLHRPFRADEWLLYVQDSPSGHGARGFCRGSVFTRDGRLIASVTQEGLMRVRKPTQPA